jgi:hypothetical protein
MGYLETPPVPATTALASNRSNSDRSNSFPLTTTASIFRVLDMSASGSAFNKSIFAVKLGATLPQRFYSDKHHWNM